MPNNSRLPLHCEDDQHEYAVVAPDGDKVVISKQLFDALSEFSPGSKCTAALVVHFRNGGIAGLEALIRKVYK